MSLPMLPNEMLMEIANRMDPEDIFAAIVADNHPLMPYFTGKKTLVQRITKMSIRQLYNMIYGEDYPEIVD